MSFPRVLLINYNDLKPPLAPIALDYIGAALEANEIEPVLADLVWVENNFDHLAEVIEKEGPFCLVAITVRNIDDSSFNTREFYLPRVREIVSWLNNEYNLPVVLGGCGFSIMPKEVLIYCGADYGIRGDGEEALVRLVNRIYKREDISDVAGLVFRDGSGEDGSSPGLQYNEPEYISFEDKDYLSRRNLVDNHKYYIKGGQGNIETKRGCDRHCIYCADPSGKGNFIRLRPPGQVASEMKNLLDRGIKYFHLCDAEFNIPLDHAREVCSAMIESGVSREISWYAYCSPTPFSEELAYLMKKAGCVGINFGIDSASEKMLLALGRDHNKKDLYDMASYCHDNKIPFMLDLLLGGPGETKETIEETIEFTRELDPLAVGVSLGVRIFKYTPLGRKITREGINSWSGLKGNVEENEDFLFPVYYLSPELGDDIHEYINELIGEDSRFFSLGDPREDKDYGYTDNQVLMDAISKGHRGAYWHILKKLSG